GGQARARKLRLGDAPALGDDATVLGVLDVAPARQLVAALAVLAAALPVALPRDHRVARAGLPDLARRQAEVDAGQAVLDALRVVLDAARVDQHRRRRLP